VANRLQAHFITPHKSLRIDFLPFKITLSLKNVQHELTHVRYFST
jgi:hypothetical protein